ncbi:hypothetical protein OS493_018553 [Desmophyllum pertusum]|uniref:Uncharacterized protein n=1 Tax=Desmophyllum pertusum TaxID=174260 RepID=A0A9X0A167_9CNID|nr:hypothetical protein OS493_018553 [Desmophyllum pertusum]
MDTLSLPPQEGELLFLSSPGDRVLCGLKVSGTNSVDEGIPKHVLADDNPPRDLADFGERIQATTIEDANKESNAPYEVVVVHSTAATTCYGCKGRVRDKPSLPVPPALYDLFIRHSERRVFNRPGETKIRISSKPEMAYYHPLRSCTGLDHDDVKVGRLIVPKDVHRLLNKVQSRHLIKEFQLELD